MLFNTSFVWHEFTGLFSTSFCHVLSDSNKQSLKEIQEVQRKAQSKKSNCKLQIANFSRYYTRVTSVQGVESLWGDCRFMPADWGS
mgnify:CR=1 FL=1